MTPLISPVATIVASRLKVPHVTLSLWPTTLNEGTIEKKESRSDRKGTDLFYSRSHWLFLVNIHLYPNAKSAVATESFGSIFEDFSIWSVTNFDRSFQTDAIVIQTTILTGALEEDISGDEIPDKGGVILPTTHRQLSIQWIAIDEEHGTLMHFETEYRVVVVLTFIHYLTTLHIICDTIHCTGEVTIVVVFVELKSINNYELGKLPNTRQTHTHSQQALLNYR